jgi:hypothetical protein
MEYFVILTLSIPQQASGTFTTTITIPAPGNDTRAGVLEDFCAAIASKHGPRWKRADVQFFSVEPNQIGTRN